MELQKILVKKGLLVMVTPTGVYDKATVAAVKAYQKASKIPATGFVLKLTRNALNAGK
jgi:peptidoglycan hydrolase-like protein with peptidoglycan-binding domain